MKTNKVRRTLCLFGALALAILCAGTVHAQFLPRLFGNKKPPTQSISHEVAQAFRPSESDLEAAKNVRNALLDAERAAQQPAEEHTLEVEGIKSETFVNQVLQEFPCEWPKRELATEIPEELLTTPQVAIETWFIECPSQMIAPKGMLAEQGWVVLPIAQHQKAHGALRIHDLLSDDNTNMAVGAMCVAEQYAPTLIRLIDTEDFAVVQKHIMSDFSKSNPYASQSDHDFWAIRSNHRS